MNRRTLKTEKLLSSSPSRKSAPIHVASRPMKWRTPLQRPNQGELTKSLWCSCGDLWPWLLRASCLLRVFSRNCDCNCDRKKKLNVISATERLQARLQPLWSLRFCDASFVPLSQARQLQQFPKVVSIGLKFPCWPAMHCKFRGRRDKSTMDCGPDGAKSPVRIPSWNSMGGLQNFSSGGCRSYCKFLPLRPKA